MDRTRVRRRRTMLATTLLAAAVGIGARASAAVGESSDAPPPRLHVVQAGDTLWSIAVEAAPGRDPREVVHAIERFNDVGSGDLVPGLALRIPTGA